MEKLRKYYVTPEKDKALERHKIHAAKRLLKLKASDIDKSDSNDSSSSSSSSSSSRSSDDIMPKKKNGNIMPSAPSSSSPSKGQQMDLEDIMNDDDNSAKSPEHVEKSTPAAAPSEKDDTSKSLEPVGQVGTSTPAAAPSENDDSTSIVSESQSSEDTDSSSEATSYICSRPKCGLVFDTAKELKDHLRKHKVKRSQDGCIHCDVHRCKNHYGMKRALQRHKKNNHDTSGMRYYCTEKVGRRKACDKSYPTEQQLNQHIRGIHGDGFIAYCGKSFTRPLGHHRHKKKCTKCKKLIQG